MSLANKFDVIIPPQDILTSDPTCLQRFAEGDKRAFELIYKNYSRKVYDYAFLMTNDASQSDDIVHDLFMRLWIKREKLRDVQYFNRYLNVMMRNSLSDYFQEKAKEKTVFKKYTYHVDTDIEQHDERAAFWEEKEKELQKAVEQMPPQQKLVYCLQRQHGLRREEIAKKLELTPLTIKSHIQHGLKFLKKCLLKS